MKTTSTPTPDFYAWSKIMLHAIGVLMGTAYGFIDTHIWTPAEAYLLVMSLVMFDFATGVLYATRTKTYSQAIANRVFFTMFAYTSLLFYSFQFSKLGGMLPILTHIVFVPMVLVTMRSLLKNFQRLGWIKNDFALSLNEKITENLKTNEKTVTSNEPTLVE